MLEYWNSGRIGVLACTAKLVVYGWCPVAAGPVNRRGRLFAQHGIQLPSYQHSSKAVRVSHAARALALVFCASLSIAAPEKKAVAPFATLDPADTPSGYLARLLINETSFPGERAYVSEADSKGSMLAVLWVLHGRIELIPKGYRQSQVAGVSSTNVIDIITGGGGKRQCEGFYLNAEGKYVTAPRVEERIQNLLSIANRGDKPGRFSGLLTYAQGLASAYLTEGIEGTDRFAGVKRAGKIEVTGRAYSWMTDVGTYHPGGNFVAIPSAQSGSLAGNRFFTLRKDPK